MQYLFRDLNSVENRVIAQEYEQTRKYLIDHIVSMKHLERMLQKKKN